MRIHLAGCARQSQVEARNRAGVAAPAVTGAVVRYAQQSCAGLRAAAEEPHSGGTLAIALILTLTGASFLGAVEKSAQQQAAKAGAQATAEDRQSPKARGNGAAWLDASLRRYLEWRKELEKRPNQARGTVNDAVRVVQQDAAPLAITAPVRPRPRAQAEKLRAALEQRGMLVWRTLETVIDRERVDRVVAAYYERYRGKTATIEDFRKICEEISGRDLRWFFDYYLGSTELPEITLRRIAGSAPNEVAGEIVVKNAPPEYQVRVEMRLYTAAGVLNHSVATSGAVTPFTVTSNEPVMRIVMDPDSRILRRVAVQKP